MKAFETRSSIDYPRKRASIACNFCRHRKRKCDGQKPTCGLCTDAGAQCVYQESERVQDVPAEILFRLNHLEVLLEQQKDAIAKLTAQVASSSPTDQSVQLSNASIYSSQLRCNWDTSSENQYGDRSSLDFSSQQSPNSYDIPFSIPLNHHTPTGSLFALDRIKYLIGDYPHNFFYLLEVKRPFDSFVIPGIPQSFNQIDKSRYDDKVQTALIDKFLEHVHPFFPIVEEKLIASLFETFPSSSKANAVDTSLCLIILALGKVSSNPKCIFDIESDGELSGAEYFASAYHNLNNGLNPPFSTDYLLPLALFYASLYLRYIGRPFQAWQLINLASKSVQFMISQLHDTSMEDERASLYRTAWGCYILECDDLAEFQFPRSGIEVVVDNLRFDKPLFPGFSNSEDMRRSREAFLAMCLIRMILNRVQENSHSISPSLHPNDITTKSPQNLSVGSLERICPELDRQLEAWFDSLPHTIQPNLNVGISPDDPYDSYIRARYYATKHIICRPSLVFAAQLTVPIPVYIYENCVKCINGCREFIWATIFLLRERTHATWLRMQALLAAIFTLSIAKTTPNLEPLIQDFDLLLGEAIKAIKPWAQHFETADTILGMIKTIRQKVRVSVHTI